MTTGNELMNAYQHPSKTKNIYATIYILNDVQCKNNNTDLQY